LAYILSHLSLPRDLYEEHSLNVDKDYHTLCGLTRREPLKLDLLTLQEALDIKSTH
jgi:hypothetical protein